MEGMKNIFPATKAIQNTEDPVAALGQRLPNTVYMFCDLANFPFDRDPILPRALRDLLTWAPSEGSCIIIVGPSFRPHPTFEKLIVVTDYALPSKDDLKGIAESIAKSAGKKFNGDALADAITPDSVAVQTTKEFTGSEQENVIESAMFEAFDEGWDITMADLMDAAVATTPLSVTASEKIDAIREWASTRARFASTVKEKTVNVGQRLIGG